MHKIFTRLAATVAVGATILGGSVLMAPAANAATPKVHYPAATEVVLVGSDAHGVRITARHVGNATTTFDGETMYKYYSVRIHRGKHDLLVVKKTSAARAVYMGGITAYLKQPYKSDAALVHAEKKALKLPYATIKARLLELVKDARKAAVKSDVRNTVDNVVTAQAIGTPDDYDVVNSNVKGKETVVVTFSEDGQNFTVVGTDSYDHYTFKFDSRTGLFTGGKA